MIFKYFQFNLKLETIKFAELRLKYDSMISLENIGFSDTNVLTLKDREKRCRKLIDSDVNSNL